MRVSNCSVLVEGGVERSTGHVSVPDKSHYAVRLMSHMSVRSDVTLTVDGKEVGTFRLGPHGSVRVEGPPSDPARGKFTFVAADSAEGVAGGSGAVSRDDRGLVVAHFRPELCVPRPHAPRYGAGGSSVSVADVVRGVTVNNASESIPNPAKEVAGITTLTGRTDQSWTDAEGITHDADKEVVVSLRLVADVVDRAAHRPLAPAPSRPASNPVPPPV